MNKRLKYSPPTIEVIQMQVESGIAGSLASGGSGTIDMPITPLNMSRSRQSYGAASGSDLEDLINDILTVEQ